MKEYFVLSLIRFQSLRCPSSFLGCKDYYHYEQDNSENDQQQAYLQQRADENVWPSEIKEGFCFSKKKRNKDINSL
jgi:hypothetical protein